MSASLETPHTELITSTVTPSQPIYPTGVISSSNTITIALNFTIEHEFESFLLYQRRPNSYLGYFIQQFHKIVIAVIKMLSLLLTPFQQPLQKLQLV
uniref:Uncharacterized protein n=1 Tax=Acrobeloides nanus TaxID=290746 RepID=A0A914BYA2_9BILA